MNKIVNIITLMLFSITVYSQNAIISLGNGTYKDVPLDSFAKKSYVDLKINSISNNVPIGGSSNQLPYLNTNGLFFKNGQTSPAFSFGSPTNGYYSTTGVLNGANSLVRTNTVLWEYYPYGYNREVSLGAKVNKWTFGIGSTGYSDARAVNSVYALENGSLGDINSPYIGHRTEANFYGDYEPHLLAVRSMVHNVSSVANLATTTTEISNFVRVPNGDIFEWQKNNGTLTNNLVANGTTIFNASPAIGGFWVKCGTNGVDDFGEVRTQTYNIPHKTGQGFKMEKFRSWQIDIKDEGQRRFSSFSLGSENFTVNARIFSFGSPEKGLNGGLALSPHPTLTIQNNLNSVVLDAIEGTGTSSFGTNFTFNRPFYLAPKNQIYNNYSGIFITDARKNSGYTFQNNAGGHILNISGKQRVSIGETETPQATLHVTKGSSDVDINVIIAKVPVYASIVAAQADSNLKTYSWYRIAEQLFIKL